MPNIKCTNCGNEFFVGNPHQETYYQKNKDKIRKKQNAKYNKHKRRKV